MRSEVGGGSTSRIAVTGAAGPVGRRVCARLAGVEGIDEVRAFDRQRSIGRGWTQNDLTVDDVESMFEGIDVVCHLAGADPLEEVDPDRDLVVLNRVLAAVEALGIGQLIVRSSATVYGARPDNPIPLTESAPLRPDADSPWVAGRVEIERRLEQFRADHPETRVAVLRPCVTVSEDGPDELGRVLAVARLMSTAEDAPPLQFVHADDVAAAVEVVWRSGLDGPYNVAPDGWIEADVVRALVGGTPRVPLSEDAARKVTDLGWRYRVAPTPPGFLPYAMHAWVVGNDRLKTRGWNPEYANDEAFIAGHEARRWASISPRRRQELALGLTTGTLLVGIGAAAAVVRRHLRSR